MENQNLHTLAINTLRFLAVDAVQKANSGHPGMPMGCAPIAFRLYTKFMKHNPSNPEWVNRDRFILSAGHGSMLLYGILHLCGYDVKMEDIKSFRQLNSITPGHPEFGLTPGVETTTGPLGQGFANAVGMAIAQEYLASIFNKDGYKIFDHFIYGICSDGDLMEGVSHEAASLAGHLKLGKIIFFYDDNGITIDGKTSLAFSENIEQRFQAYGWQTLYIKDVNDLDQIDIAVINAQKDERPTLIITKTHIGYGSPNKQDSEKSHGSPLGVEEVKLTKKNLGWFYEEEFFIPDEVKKYFSELKEQFNQFENEWNDIFNNYSTNFTNDAITLQKIMQGKFKINWNEITPEFDINKNIATREASGIVLQSLANNCKFIIGGSADLAPSNNTFLKNEKIFSSDERSGRNFHFGIREHAMGSILNGMALYGMIIPYGGTFLVFSDYMRPAIRLAALSHIRPIYVFTHDSIGLGEDGPTHQPVEHIAALRAIPNLTVIRPADAYETFYSWKEAIEINNGPVALILTRQGVPVIDRSKFTSVSMLDKGAYVLYQTNNSPDLILIASGSEVQLIIDAAKIIEAKNYSVRIVSFPSWELFEKQSEEYKESVFSTSIKKRIVVEAGVSVGWEKYAGSEGKIICMNSFGASAPYKDLFQKFGFTVDNIINTAMTLLEK